MSHISELDKLPKETREAIKSIINNASNCPDAIDTSELIYADSVSSGVTSIKADYPIGYDRLFNDTRYSTKEEFIQKYKKEVEEYFELNWKAVDIKNRLERLKRIRELVEIENLDLDLTDVFLIQKKLRLEGEGIDKKLYTLKHTKPEFCEYCDLLMSSNNGYDVDQLYPYEEWKKHRKLNKAFHGHPGISSTGYQVVNLSLSNADGSSYISPTYYYIPQYATGEKGDSGPTACHS